MENQKSKQADGIKGIILDSPPPVSFHQPMPTRAARKTIEPVYYHIVCLLILAGSAFAGDAPPNPYQIFAEENPLIYRIPAAQSSRMQGDTIPDLSQRPPALRPGPLATGVRYSFATNSSMADAAVLLTNYFCGQSHEPTTIFNKTLVVHPGAWTDLRQLDVFGKKSATPWGFMVWDGKAYQNLAGIVLRDTNELKQVESFIRKEVENGGGATVRALSTTEMKKWWIFIGFDIQEPTLVLETRDKKRLFIFGFMNRQVVVFDDLNSLPNF